MTRKSNTSSDSTALRRELEALRAERLEAVDARNKPPEKEENPARSAHADLNWDEFEHALRELGEELENVASRHATIGIVGALILGIVIGRAVSR
jgi:hypothetical protein